MCLCVCVSGMFVCLCVCGFHWPWILAYLVLDNTNQITYIGWLQESLAVISKRLGSGRQWIEIRVFYLTLCVHALE